MSNSEESKIAYLYDGWNLIAELDALQTSPFKLQTSYIWGLDLSGSLQGVGGVGGLLSVIDQSGSTFSPVYDSNGNVMGYYATDTEVVVAEYEYGPFGELVSTTGSKADDFKFRFSTKYEDTEKGLLYYGYRYYDSETGRWLSRDPIGENGGLNLYGFVENDGVNYWDYLGREKAGGSYVTIDPDAKGNNPFRNNQTGQFESRQNYIDQVNGDGGPRPGFDADTGPKVPNPVLEIGKSTVSK